MTNHRKEYIWRDINGNLSTGKINNHPILTSDLENMGIIQQSKQTYPVDRVPFGGALGNLYRRLDSGDLFHH